jgi:hypothetical protein
MVLISEVQFFFLKVGVLEFFTISLLVIYAEILRFCKKILDQATVGGRYDYSA